jgi:hypothetical protein
VHHDHKTVAKDRADLEARGEIPHVSTRTDAAGRQQSATKPPKPQSVEELREQAEARTAAGFNAKIAAQKTLLRRLDGVLHDLKRQRTELLQIPLALRVPRARALLEAFGVSLHDLRPIDGNVR